MWRATRSAPAIDDRPQTVDVEPEPENVKRGVFRSAQKKRPLLTSGEPRRSSIFWIDLEARPGAADPMGRDQARRQGTPGTAKNYISCREQRSPPCSRRCAGLAAIDVVAGTVFCLSDAMSALASPRLESVQRYTMRVSDLRAFTGASFSPGSINSAKISCGFRRTGCTLRGRMPVRF